MKRLEITTLIGCLNRCSYCPQDLLIRNYKDPKKRMNFEDFKLIMSNVPKDVAIDFSGFSEAFLNSQSALMMKYCIENKYQTILYTTLVGITKSDIETLKGLIFTDVVFHRFEHVNAEEFDRNRSLFEKNIQSLGRYRLNIVNKDNEWSRAGNLYEQERLIGPCHCQSSGKDFDHNVVLPNGDVYSCCMDYSLKHKIGNLLETKYNDLDRTTLKKLSNKNKSDLLCRTCELCKKDYVIHIPGLT
jgi:radical SAM protein with 4Fe4S-binding SPASM domain